MSLENEIKKLTSAIEKLTATLNAQQPTSEKVATPTSEKVEKVEEVTSTKAKFADVTEFSNAVKKLVRAKPEIKTQVRGTLGEHGYKVLADVPQSDFESIYSQIEAL